MLSSLAFLSRRSVPFGCHGDVGARHFWSTSVHFTTVSDCRRKCVGTCGSRESFRGVSSGGPNGIRAVVGLDLTFSIRGVAIRQQGDELGPTPPLA